MPVEAARLQHQLGPRDRRMFAVIAGACVLLAGGGGAFAVLESGHDDASKHCTVVPGVGVMGGGDWHLCTSTQSQP
jgi:hypothetical protein